MGAKNPYMDLYINLDLIPECITSIGASNISFNKDRPNEYHLKFTFNGSENLIRLYPKSGGLYTIGKAIGHAENFTTIADTIKRDCIITTQQRFENTTKFSDEQLNQLFEFLKSEEVVIKELNPEAHCRIFKADGKSGDTLRIKRFNNGSVQFQGRFLDTAFLVTDFLCNILGMDEIVSQQIRTFNIPITKQQMNAELLHRMPVSNGYVHDVIMKQIACSLTLSKIDVELEDYSSITHSVLRALEGFLFQVLQLNFKPENASKVGEYFEKTATQDYKLTNDRAKCCDHPEMANILGQCYTYFHDTRHALFHMKPILAGTVTISMQQARNIIDEICDLIEGSVRKLKK